MFLFKGSLWAKLNTFRNKLMLGFLLVSVIPTALVGVFSYRLSHQIAEEKILDSISYSSSQLTDALASRFKQMENASDTIQFYLNAFVLQPDDSISEQLDKFSELRNNISRLQYTFDFFNINVYFKPDLLFSNEGINYFKIDQLPNHGVTPETFNGKINQLQWGLLLGLTEPFMKGGMERRNYISSYIAYKPLGASELDYAFFIDLNEKEIAGMLRESIPDPSVNSMIVDRSGLVISAIDESRLGTTISGATLHAIRSAADQAVALGDSRLVVNHLSVSDWYLVTEVPNVFITNNINVLINIIIIILLAAIVTAVIASLLTSNSLSTKIRRMSKILSGFKVQDSNSNLVHYHIPVDQNQSHLDELDRLAVIFNTMLQKMEENFDRFLEHTLREENLRYMLLQSKINPHFLYNILESIKTCQSLGRIDDANTMITRLARFYRLLLKKNDDLIPIADELEIASLYLGIEELNYKDAFTFRIDSENGIGDFLIPKFTLQPLLENCIRHGLSNMNCQLQIQVDLFFLEEEIGIRIRDNGAGIPPDKLVEIQNTLRNRNVNTERFYGISNVNVRLSQYALSNRTLEIESEPSIGTTVTAAIRQMIPDEQHW
ncbi:sensor histidine kinase [Cohnella sp. 56]|uniref:sensor histidine kinase n=1 Tax=Cohnella sp. 56 TaxID=3113722 RepID=UPI0030F37816